MSETESAAVMELTEREIALAQGVDPDEAIPEAVSAPEETQEVDNLVTDGSEQDADAGDGGGKEAAEPSVWFGVAERKTAEDYFLTEDDLASFADADEFRRTVTLLDRRLVSQSQESESTAAVGDSSDGATGEASGGEQSTDTAPKSDPMSEIPDLDLDAYRKGEYEPETLAVVEVAKATRGAVLAVQAENQQLRADVEQLRGDMTASQEVTQAAQDERALTAFNDVVDSLGDPLFGNSVDADGNGVAVAEAEGKNRAELFAATQVLKGVLQARGMEVPAFSALVRGAREQAFGEQLRERDRKELEARVAAQSRKRRPAAGGRTQSSPGKSEIRKDEDVANDPDVVAAWDKMQDENGS